MNQIDRGNLTDQLSDVIARFFGFHPTDVAIIYEREKSLDGTIALCDGAKQNGKDDLLDYYFKTMGESKE